MAPGDTTVGTTPSSFERTDWRRRKAVTLARGVAGAERLFEGDEIEGLDQMVIETGA